MRPILPYARRFREVDLSLQARPCRFIAGLTDREIVIGLIVAAIVARLVMFALVDPLYALYGGDDAFYLGVARNLLAGAGYTYNGVATAFRPPAYGAFVALLGAKPALIIMAQEALSLGTALFTFHALKRADRAIASLTAFLIATSPFLICVEFKIYSEVLYIELLWISWLLLFTGRRLGSFALAGLLLGLAILTRDTLLLLPPFAALFSLFDRMLFKRFAIAFLVSYAMILPWQIRNTTIPNGGFEVSQGRFGYNLWIGTWERTGDWMLPSLDNARYPPEAFRSEQEKEELLAAWKRQDDQPFERVAIDRIASAPAATAGIWAKRYYRMWLGTRTDQVRLRPAPGSAAWTVLKSAFYGLNIVTLLLGFAGLLMALRTKWSFFATPVIYTAAIYIPFHNVETRYSLIALPFLYLFGAFAIRKLGCPPVDRPA
jgi:hypothetical protein